MRIIKFSYGPTYRRSDEPPSDTIEVELNLKFENEDEAIAFHSKIVDLLIEKLKEDKTNG